MISFKQEMVTLRTAVYSALSQSMGSWQIVCMIQTLRLRLSSREIKRRSWETASSKNLETRLLTGSFWFPWVKAKHKKQYLSIFLMIFYILQFYRIVFWTCLCSITAYCKVCHNTVLFVRGTIVLSHTKLCSVAVYCPFIVFYRGSWCYVDSALFWCHL